MIRLRRCIPFLLVVLCTFAPETRADLENDVELAIVGAGLQSASIAVSVVEAGTGRTLVDHDADRMMIPASNMKLVTTGAALHVLGADFRFQTRLIRDGDRLIVVGDGDPAFGDPELLSYMTTEDGLGLGVEGFLKLWTDAVIATGVKQWSEIVVDDRVFDRAYVHSTWPRDQLNRRYCAQVSGLNFHLNQLHFYPDPRPERRPSLARFDPRTTHLRIQNNATSNDGTHDGNTVWVARRPETNDLTFYGNAKHPYRVPVPVTAHEMALLFGEILGERLQSEGVSVDSIRLSRESDGPSAGEVIGPVIYTPIDTVVTRCNQDSQNLYAECLLKRMGYAMTSQPGSWLNGASIVRHAAYERLDSPRLSSTIVIADGSGLSRDNRIAPSTMTSWLESFHDDELLGATFLGSLAVGGRSGTLLKRLNSGSLEHVTVHAKSGYINEVSCLSGYVTAADGRRRCFSIMINEIKGPIRRAKALQDRIVEAIAASLETEPIEEPASITQGGE